MFVKFFFMLVHEIHKQFASKGKLILWKIVFLSSPRDVSSEQDKVVSRIFIMILMKTFQLDNIRSIYFTKINLLRISSLSILSFCNRYFFLSWQLTRKNYQLKKISKNVYLVFPIIKFLSVIGYCLW